MRNPWDFGYRGINFRILRELVPEDGCMFLFNADESARTQFAKNSNLEMHVCDPGVKHDPKDPRDYYITLKKWAR